MNADRDRLVGLLAMDLGLLRAEDLAECSSAAGSSGQDLVQQLVACGRLSLEDSTHLQYLAERGLAQHQGDGRAAPDSYSSHSSRHKPAEVLPFDERSTLSPSQLPPPPVQAPEGPREEVPEFPSRFERCRVHGAGGIGRVWLARDRILDREVAVKELRPERSGDAELTRRFLEEARVTAQLQHPGIVPVYDLLPLPPGQSPYYVMRLVQGRTLTQAINAYHTQRRQGQGRALEQRTLLTAFVTICQTLAFAHAQGIIHRDIKGQNLILGNFGEVIVLDWGLARRVGSADSGSAESVNGVPLADSQPSHTQTGQILGTPHYMAPEQAAGQVDRIDHRTDIYSLGAMLYEILTGQPPHALPASGGGSPAPRLATEELLRRIREEPPPRPRQLVASVAPALEAVCLKALAREPDQRYQSAAELGREVQRWLADEPVVAYPEPWPARLGRWARHHRAQVAALGMFLLVALMSLSIATVLIARERARTEEARVLAERNFHRAREAVDRYFTQVSEEKLLNEPGMQPLRNRLLESARDFYEGFVQERAADVESRQGLAQALLNLGRIRTQLGQRTIARDLFTQARDQFAQLAQESPYLPEYRHSLAKAHVALGNELVKDGLPQAETELETARALWARLLQESGGRQYRKELANVHNSLAMYHSTVARLSAPMGRQEQLRQAEAEQRQALASWRQLAEAEPEVPARIKDLALAYNNLAIICHASGKAEEVRAALERSLELSQQLVRKHERVVEYRVGLARACINLSNCLSNERQLEAAEGFLRQGITIYERLARQNPLVLDFHTNLASAYFNLGNLHFRGVTSTRGEVRAQHLARGKEALERALITYQRLKEEYPEDRRFPGDEALTLTCLGNLLLEEDPAVALPWFERAIALLERMVPPECQGGVDEDLRRALAHCYWGRAEQATRAGRLAEAVGDWDRAVRLSTGGEQETLRARQTQARLQLAAQFASAGDYQKAAAEVARLSLAALSAEQRAKTARILALSTQAATAAQSPLVAALAEQTVTWLRQAQQADSFRASGQASLLELCRSIPAIASRVDFQQFLREIGGTP